MYISHRFPTRTLLPFRMHTTPPVHSFISFNYKRATQYSGVPTSTGSLIQRRSSIIRVFTYVSELKKF